MRKLYRYIKESIILRINVYIYMAGQEVGMKKARLEIYTRLNERLDTLLGDPSLLINQGSTFRTIQLPDGQ